MSSEYGFENMKYALKIIISVFILKKYIYTNKKSLWVNTILKTMSEGII